MREVLVSPPSPVDIAAQTAAALSREPDVQLRLFVPERASSELSARFPHVFALFERIGMHPQRPGEAFDPYTNQPARESFHNIGVHCVAVAHAAAKIAGAMVRAGVIDAAAGDLIVERGLVHDVSKPFEVMRRDARRSGLIGDDAYSISAYEKLRPLLVENGFRPDTAAYIAGAGSETGHNSLKDFVLAGPEGTIRLIEGAIPEKIVHLADDMTFTSMPLKEGEEPVTMFLTPWERMLASRFIEKYPWLWKEGLGRLEDGALAPIKDVNNPAPGVLVLGDYASLQVQVAAAICRELQLYLAPGSGEEPERFIKRLISH